MLRASQRQKRPAAFQHLTGVTPDEFDTIVELAQPLWIEAELERLNNRQRQRAMGAGARFKLEIEARILMTLIYPRQYCTQEFLGWLLFNLDRSNVCRNIKLMLPFLEQALPGPIRARTLQAELDTIPREGWSTGKRKKIGTLKAFLEVFPKFEDVIVDSTEQERSQPKKTKQQPKSQKPAGRPKNH